MRRVASALLASALAIGAGVSVFRWGQALSTPFGGTGMSGAPQLFSGSASLNFAAINNQDEGTITVSVVGALTTDMANCAPSAPLEAGLAVSYAYVSSADTVTIVLLNGSAAPIDPAAATFICQVVR